MGPEDLEKLKAEPSILLSGFAELAPMLEEALATGGRTHTLGDVLMAIAENKAQAWIGRNCIGVTTIEVHPLKRVLRYWIAAGDMDELLALRPGIEAYGRGMNCDVVLEVGRKGWARVFKDEGYREEGVVISKDLRHG